MSVNGRYDIGCVCMFNYNIGNNLTNFALYTTLKEMGYSVLMIGSRVDAETNPLFLEAGRFGRFLKKPYEELDVHPGCGNKWEYYLLNDTCEMFLVGSDQLWRGSFLRGSDFFYALDWVRNDKYKMSVATSFGVDYYDGTEQDYAKESFFLKRINSISVREKAGAKQIKEMTGIDAKVVLDPVFLCDEKKYRNMALRGNSRIPKEPYVGGYILDITEEKKNIFLHLADKATKGYNCVITDYDESRNYENDIYMLKDSKIEEWLALICNCEVFVTDSFHGICFALILKKQFCVVFDKDNWRGYDRIKNILEEFGLLDRVLDKYTSEEIERVCAKKIDYDAIGNNLGNKRDELLKYLQNEIEKRKEYKGKYSSYDFQLENVYSMETRLRDELRRIEKNRRNEAFITSLFMGKMSVGEVIAFGCGNCFKRNVDFLTKVCDISYVCDNDPEKWGNEVENGIKCISPRQLAGFDNVSVVIMIDDISVAFDISKQLIELGITNFTHITNWLKKLEG